jgi:glutamate synthase domain-containing protein 3
VVLYGAILGEAYFRGLVGERFAVRNSGASTVVEGVGDHGCEYMTGGRVVIIGPTGRNFAAGMSGGIAYVWDREGLLHKNCNTGMVDLFPVKEQKDIAELKALIEKHLKYTQSTVARGILNDWSKTLGQFIKVYPRDYRRVIEEAEAIKNTDTIQQSLK